MLLSSVSVGTDGPQPLTWALPDQRFLHKARVPKDPLRKVNPKVIKVLTET